jgi:hypothetical protein
MLIVINTWKRAEMLKTVLAEVVRVKHPDTQIGIVDDCTPDWVAPEVDFVWQPDKHLGVGMARHYAIECCLRTSHDTFLVMDNDMMVKPGFDTDIVELWHTHRSDHIGCLASPFRTTYAPHVVREMVFRDYIYGTSSHGAMLCMDRPVAADLLARMVPELWTNWWDWVIGGFVNGFIKPKYSYAAHIGTDADAVHSPL